MNLSESARSLSTNFRRSLMTSKPHPGSHPYLRRNEDDIYLNIQMPAIFSPSQQKSLQIFNRKLQQSLKQRDIQQALKITNEQLTQHKQKKEIQQKNRSYWRKIIFTNSKKQKSQVNIQFQGHKSLKDSPNKKFSVDVRPQTTYKKSILNIPPIIQSIFEQNSFINNLIPSSSNKNLINKLLKRKRFITQQDQPPQGLFRYPLNRKILNKGNRKSHNIKGAKLIVLFNEPANQQKQESLMQPAPKSFHYQQAAHYKNRNLFLSPSRKRQSFDNIKITRRKTTKCLIDKQNESDELGPWKQDAHANFDI